MMCKCGCQLRARSFNVTSSAATAPRTNFQIGMRRNRAKAAHSSRMPSDSFPMGTFGMASTKCLGLSKAPNTGPKRRAARADRILASKGQIRRLHGRCGCTHSWF
jgi:hypothetical protein